MLKTNVSRTIYADLLRIAATLGVVFIHVGGTGWYATPSYSWDWQSMNMWHAIFRWPVPLFVMISGIFNIKNYRLDMPMKFGIAKIAKKIFHIYCALIFWTVFYRVLYPIISYNIKEFFTNPLTFLNFNEIIRYPYQTISGDGWYHLWFLYMIIGLYFLTPLVKVFVVNCKRNYLEYLLLVAFVIGICIPFYNFIGTLKDIPLLPRKIHIQVPELSGYIGYYLAGYYFSEYNIKRNTKYCLYGFGILSMIFTIWGTSFISIKTNNLNQTLLSPTAPNIAIQTIAIFVFFKSIFENMNFSNSFNNIIANISKCSFGIYLLHDFFIRIVINYIGIGWNTFNPIISVPIMCIIIFLLSYLAALVISKIPVLKRYII